MKKLILAFAAIISTFILSSNASAATVDLSRYPSETLEETFVEEGITYDFTTSDYSDAGDKVTLYVFRKDGCGNCKAFYEFIKNTLLPQYGSKFKVVSYELSNNAINFTLLGQLAEYYNQKPADGVYSTPIVFVGDTMSKGYVDATRQQEIINIINSGTTFNVVDELNDGMANINDSMKTTFTAANNVTLITTNPYYRSHTLSSNAIDASSLSLDGYEYISAYDINLMDNAAVVPLSGTSLTIRIPISKTYKTYKIAYIENGKIVETINTKYENGFVTFNTSHLSEYAVYGSNTETLTPTDTTQTTTNTKKPTPTTPNGGVQVTNATEVAMSTLVLATAFSVIGFILYRERTSHRA